MGLAYAVTIDRMHIIFELSLLTAISYSYYLSLLMPDILSALYILAPIQNAP